MMRHDDDLLSLPSQVHKLLLLLCHEQTYNMFKHLKTRFLLLVTNTGILAMLMADEACKLRQ